MQKLAHSVLRYIRAKKLLKAGDRCGVAVSGGADSVALLRLLLELKSELGIVLFVVHFNHRLRGEEADADERFVAGLAEQYKLEARFGSGDVPRHAAGERLSLETAARKLRYAYFQRLLQEGTLDRIATAHTLDDQAETVLLKITRGAGTRGLAGIYPLVGSQHLAVSSRPGRASIIRPLLATRRSELEDYLKDMGQPWREDSSNRDLRHMRNRVRHGILPRLERSLNPAVREALAETAEIARAEEAYWQEEIARVLPEVWNHDSRDLQLGVLASLPLAVQRRVVRAAAESLGATLEFRHVEEIMALALEKQGAAAALPGNWRVVHQGGCLHFAPGSQASPESYEPESYEYELRVPGCTFIAEVPLRVEVRLVKRAEWAGYNPEELLDPGLSARALSVRNWRAGDRYWPVHRKAPRKIKELLQEQHASGNVKKLWPVVASGADLVWVRGFPPPARMQAPKGAAEALVIRETGDEPGGTNPNE